jgi:hypothetical protein
LGKFGIFIALQKQKEEIKIMSKETEPITPLPYITKTQMMEMLRDLFQEIPTKTDFEQLKESVSTSNNSGEKRAELPETASDPHA